MTNSILSGASDDKQIPLYLKMYYLERLMTNSILPGASDDKQIPLYLKMYYLERLMTNSILSGASDDKQYIFDFFLFVYSNSRTT